MKKPKARENVLTPEERQKLLSVIQNEDEELAVKGLLFTGMRISEFIHMRKDWIDQDKGLINVPYKMKCSCYECLAKPGEHKGYFMGKTKHAERPIPIVPEVKDLFKNTFTKYDSVMDVLQNRVNAWKLVKNVGLRAKLVHKVFPHSLRATFATILCEKGITNPVTLKDIMGWKKLDMATEYVKLSGVGMKKEIDEIW
jgi:integrase